MIEGVYGCFMTGNVFLAGNSEVSLELQCFTAELITYIVCECDAPECLNTDTVNYTSSSVECDPREGLLLTGRLLLSPKQLCQVEGGLGQPGLVDPSIQVL